jgi:hypothetical protein
LKFADVMDNVSTLNEAQLGRLNRAVIAEMKGRRNYDAALKRRTLSEGDRVSWTGRNGYTEGTIIRIKRKKAICDVDSGSNWDVPLNMLTVL